MILMRVVFGAALAAFALAACLPPTPSVRATATPGSAPTQGSPTPTGAGEPDLANSTWILASFEREGSKAQAPAGSITLAFGGDGQAGGSSGCNTYGGSYQVSGSAISFGPLASTEMACLDETLMRQEAEYLAMLSAVQRLALEGDALALTGEGVRLTYTRGAGGEQPGPLATPGAGALAGTAWQLESWLEGETVSSAAAGVAQTLAFSGDGQASGSGGCNRFHAPYTQEGDRISIGPVGSTKMACEGVMEQEQRYFAALAQAERFEIAAGRLTIYLAEGQAGLVFTVPAQTSP